MDILAYNLKGKGINSNAYYEKLKVVSKRIKNLLFDYGKIQLEEFMIYVVKNNIEDLRTKDEYAIEFLMIGAMLKDYRKYIKKINKGTLRLFKVLNKLREGKSLNRNVDKIRGYLISNILMKEVSENYDYDINILINWMEASGDFKEEVYRMKVWGDFLKVKDEEYKKKFFKQSLSIAESMCNICDGTIGLYIKQLDIFLKKAKHKYKNREDLIYCTKGKVQYYFNMVSAQIMNEVYSEQFLQCKDKKIFAPGCMRQVQSKCKAAECEYGLKCKKCSINCNINNLNNLMENRYIDVCIIPHETIINKIDVKEKNKIGIIGIACIPNLMSGGWKALRLGFIPQCVLLDYSGCGKHWLDKEKITEINEIYLEKEILGKKH
ncbi:DUF116 domain-containing protein [Clostridium sp. 1001271B_151109_B4]|uniref:DUF116 domain-containing protein n=1 Tax=Clostridium sp. 1001271B_151109_B4 TaxID=2787148 RepID=UPI0018AAF919|nr:DUF116 domain-containing protein [Clostridium sp. 1001271B_151109_B4]